VRPSSLYSLEFLPSMLVVSTMRACTNLHFSSHIQYYWLGQHHHSFCARQGDAQRKDKRFMPLRRRSYFPLVARDICLRDGPRRRKREHRHLRPPMSAPRAQKRDRYSPVSPWSDADSCGGILERSCGPRSRSWNRSVSEICWYDLVGTRSASGEILDTIHPLPRTDRSHLPLAPRVTTWTTARSAKRRFNCQNQHRGPYDSWTILDVSRVLPMRLT